jgi:tRNA 2-thiocytidine biosynthesis protein TtcA
MLVQINEPSEKTTAPTEGRGEVSALSSEVALRPSNAMLKLSLEAINRFELIQPGDRIAVGYSGGKDSLALISLLSALQLRDDFDFEMKVIHLDQQQPGFKRDGFNASLERLGVACEVITKDTWSVVKEKRRPGQIPCALCSRMRRGILNKWCSENGYNKLALGHHLDDALETFFLNMLFGRNLRPLTPTTRTTDGDVTTIRPFILVEEAKLQAWVDQSGLSPIDCPVCDNFPDAKRRDLKGLFSSLSTVQSELHASIREALYGLDSPLELSPLLRDERPAP